MAREAPLSLRPGAARQEMIAAWAEEQGLSQHAALLALIDLGLGMEVAPVEKREVPAGPGIRTASQMAEAANAEKERNGNLYRRFVAPKPKARK